MQRTDTKYNIVHMQHLLIDNMTQECLKFTWIYCLRLHDCDIRLDLQSEY